MSEFDTPNYADYFYDVKSEGKIKLARILLISAYVVFTLGLALFLILNSVPQLVAVVPFLVVIFYLCTWRYVSYDYYFVFQSGMLELGKYRNSKGGPRKYPKLRIHVKEASFGGAYAGNESLVLGKRVFDFSESQLSDKRIILLFEKDTESCCAIFEGTAKVAKLIASFCPNAGQLKGAQFHG